MKTGPTLAQILFTLNEPVDSYEFKCRDVLPSLPDVPPAPPRGIGHTFGYYHCQPMTAAHEIKLKDCLQMELKKWGHLFNEQSRKTYDKFSLDDINARVRKDFGSMAAIKTDPDAFLVCGHGTYSHIVRWESIVLLKKELSLTKETPEIKGYWTAKRLFDHMTCYEPCIEKVRKFETCKYIIILACNTGNDLDKIDAHTEKCFAQELAELTNKPCYAPQGYLDYTEVTEPSVWSSLHDPVTLKPTGQQRKFKMFYPSVFTGRIPEPKKINFNVR